MTRTGTSLAIAFASTAIGCGPTGGPGVIGVYAVDAATLTPEAGVDATVAGPGDAEVAAGPDGATVDGVCRTGHYAGTYAGFWQSGSSSILPTSGAFDMTLSAGDGGLLVAAGTWSLNVVGDVAYPLVLSGTLDCDSLAFNATAATVPASSARGLLFATYAADAGALEEGDFVISLNNDEPPMRGTTPNPGITGTFRATWVGP